MQLQTLLTMMNSRTYLAPHDPKRKTHLVMDASPCGIAASLYQEDDQGKWVPVDDTSRALSLYKQGWDSQIDWESLAKVWGMMMFRPYLMGVHFMSWGERKPLLPLYNEMSKAAPVRVARHRNKVQDLRFTNKYLPGKAMPCDYAFRHALPRRGYGEQERLSKYLDKTDIGAGNLDNEGWGRDDMKEGVASGGRNEAKPARTLNPRARAGDGRARTTTC